MKKILIFLLMTFSSIIVFAQNSNDKFFKENTSFTKDVSNFLVILKESSPKKMAKAIKELGHINKDNQIEFQYVIEANDTIDPKKFFQVVDSWAKSKYTNPEKCLISKTGNSITFRSNNKRVRTEGYGYATNVTSQTYLKIELKSNRYRITSSVNSYSFAAANIAKAKEGNFAPGSVYPYVDSDYKQIFSKACIIAFASILDNLDFINYINKNYSVKEDVW